MRKHLDLPPLREPQETDEVNERRGVPREGEPGPPAPPIVATPFLHPWDDALPVRDDNTIMAAWATETEDQQPAVPAPPTIPPPAVQGFIACDDGVWVSELAVTALAVHTDGRVTVTSDRERTIAHYHGDREAAEAHRAEVARAIVGAYDDEPASEPDDEPADEAPAKGAGRTKS